MSQAHHSVDPVFGANLVYYNATVVNNTATPLPALVNDTRNAAIIHIPEKWEMSIVRFDIDTSLIPVAKLPIYDPIEQEYTTLGVTYVAGGESTGVHYGRTYTQGVEMSMQAVVDVINSAFDSFSAVEDPKPPGAPYLWYDAEAQLLKLFAPEEWLTSPIVVYVTKSMRRYLRGLPFTYAGLSDGRDFRLTFDPSWQRALDGQRSGFPDAVQPPAYASNGLVYRTQEAQLLSSWSACRSIYITTDSFPVQSESIPNSVLLSNRGSVSSGSIPIITDFILPTDGNPVADRDRLEYLPTAEYRMVQLGGREPITRVNLQAWWTDFSGNSYPVLLSEDGSFSAKILFRKRSTFQA